MSFNIEPSENLKEEGEIEEIEEQEEMEEQGQPIITNDSASETLIQLQLGDVIHIINPLNEMLNNQTFIIDYIDRVKLILINIDTFNKTKLKISEGNVLGDGNIEQITILSRSDSPGFARQHNLLPGTWVNIIFGGDYPKIITGEITNLEEDMIELKVDDKTIYINFDYKGLPEHLPIENIEIREKPQLKPPVQTAVDDEIETRPILEELEKEKHVLGDEKIEINTTNLHVKNQLREVILRADQIEFGYEDIGTIKQLVNVNASSKRFSIDEQVADLLDNLLSTIPNAQRTPRVLNNIHIIIERYKQLREKFSFKDEYGNVEGKIIKEASYKPLTKYYNEFREILYWILPVVKNVKKIYDANEVLDENSDVVNIMSNTDNKKVYDIIQNYKSNNISPGENKYVSLYSDLNNYFTPFENISNEQINDILIEKEVNNEINTIVNNLEDMDSSIFSENAINQKKFVMQKYNTGLSKLELLDSTSSQMISKRINMTPNDLMSISSFITLPESTMRFSKIRLPNTSILDKANLNLLFLNYWQLLKNKTPIHNIVVDKLDKNILFTEDNFANNIKNYILNLSKEDKYDIDNHKFTRDEIYSKFINTITPRTKILFNLMKKYIVGKLSLVDVVNYLEPFLVYTDDLTYNQYKDITDFIDEQISNYNKSQFEKMKLFNSIKRVYSDPLNFNNAYTIISLINSKITGSIFEDYDLEYNKQHNDFSNYEYLRKMMLKDNGKLYTTAISLQSIPLMFPSEFSELFEKEKDKLTKTQEEEKEKKGNEDKKSCKSVIISKYYISMEELQSDNDKTIYFDKKYDKTNYGVLENDYGKELITKTPEDLKIHIINDLVNKKNLSQSDAEYLADTLLDGYKKVIDGQYAVFYKGYNLDSNKEIDYYVRKNNKWVLDEDISSDINTDDSSLLCDLQEKCMVVPGQNNMDDKCTSMSSTMTNTNIKLLKDVVNEFDTRYKISKELFEKEIQTKMDYYTKIIEVLANIENANMLKYNNQKYKLGLGIEDERVNKPVSPHIKLLNLILGQKDFSTRQHNIIKFVNTYTRSALEGYGPLNEKESEHWLYCIDTNVRLLPAYVFNLADTFVEEGVYAYKDYMELVKSSIGRLSDDGDWWVDMNSGWPICPVDFDVEEGYEEGFKVSSRGVIEQDVGATIMSNIADKLIKYNTPETIMINNIINAMSFAMNINIETQKEFIINCVITSLRATLESESDYKKKVQENAEKGKKTISYKDFYHTALIYYTLGMFLIGIQTAIPPVKTKKTHPGCKKSFSGFPFEGQGAEDGLNYVGCVAYDIRDSGEPWNVLKGKKQDIIVTKIKSAVTNVLLPLLEVTRKFQDKTDYLLSNPSDDIPEEHSIAKWTNFLPPLVPFKIKHLLDISENFKCRLMVDLRSGANSQREKVLVIESKIIHFSLAIQEKIQEIVKNQNLLLYSHNKTYYIENSCCDSKERETAISYFSNKDPTITEYNEIVTRLSNILSDINEYSKAGLFYSIVNTKNQYPSLNNIFDEKTIYLSFIHFCKFNSLMPIPRDLLPLCNEKPDLTLINQNDSIERIIQKLKEDGKVYTNEQLLRLLQLIGRNNIVNIDLTNKNISSMSVLSDLLDDINHNNDLVVEGALIKLMLNAIMTYEKPKSDGIKKLNDYLHKGIGSMKDEIIEFIKTKSGSSISKSSIKQAVKILQSLSIWETDNSSRNEELKISNDKMYNIIQFYKSFIDKFVNVFPNIILNKVENNNISIPSYLGFSTYHENKLKKYVSEYYKSLKSLYGINSIQNILSSVPFSCKNLTLLSKLTPCFTSKMGENEKKPIFDERTSRFLYEYYLLRVLLNYIELTDDDDMLINEFVNETDFDDIYSPEHIDEVETKIDITIGIKSKGKSVDAGISRGNKKNLEQTVSQMIIAFLSILNNEKDTIDISYETIQDRIFKLKEKEKNIVTDNLKGISDEARNVDTILKITKQGMYNKGLQSGLTMYDKDFYDDERDLREQMDITEKKVRQSNKNVTDDNVNFFMDDQMEQDRMDKEIDDEVYDMEFMNEDFYNGNTDGLGAPEEEEDDYGDFD